MKELGILSIRELIRYDKIKYCSSPSYLQESFHTIAEVHEKPLENSEIDFRCKQMSTDGGQRGFLSLEPMFGTRLVRLKTYYNPLKPF